MDIGDDELHTHGTAVGPMAEKSMRHVSISQSPMLSHAIARCLSHGRRWRSPRPWTRSPVLPGSRPATGGRRDGVQTALSQFCDIHVDVGTSLRLRRLRDAPVAPKGLVEIISLAGRCAGAGGGHDHRPQGPVSPTTRPKELREEAALAQLRIPTSMSPAGVDNCLGP